MDSSPTDEPPIDLEQIHEMFEEQARWASLSISVKDISEANNKLVRDLSKYSAKTAVPLLAGLLTLPALQSNCIRLEILITLAVAHCKGTKKANIKCASHWFYSIGRSLAVLGEDPAEDVFVTLVRDSVGDYRLLEGCWEAAGFYTQRVLDVVTKMPDTGGFEHIKKSTHALLIISDIVCEKSGLTRYQMGSDKPLSVLKQQLLPSKYTLSSRVTILLDELDANNITLHDLAPFLLPQSLREELPDQQIGQSHLDRYPLIQLNSHSITVAMPSVLSVAIRNFVIEIILENDLVNDFDNTLALTYSDLFTNTPLLGGRLGAPIHWRKSGNIRYASFSYSVDEGYIISFQIFQPSISCHSNGGFKEVYQDDGTLSNIIQKQIVKTVDFYDKQQNFREGIVIITGCGWGKGLTTWEIKLNHPKWRIELISAADLVRLSWLKDMNPSYFWRIQDGLETIQKAGVRISNANGILNLIGWVRSNDGHFVPHAQLPKEGITPDQPIHISIPTNLLRNVRVDSDWGYDRHIATDNTGLLHNVQRISPNQLFASNSSKKIYASMDDMQQGVLTSVYEGKFHLWLSLTTPNLSTREIKYRLWEMANGWLHRIGRELDNKHEDSFVTPPCKIHVRFLDIDPEYSEDKKPDRDALQSLCKIERHSEPNSCRATFLPGFISGFSIADNVAEQLFTQTLVQAYIQLLNLSEKVSKDAIVTQVVQNNEARSFHIFTAQNYIDFVQHTLPNELISIDPIDDATIKLGLASKAIDIKNKSKITGKNACTEFLGNVVDVLIDQISDSSSKFNLLDTLLCLVNNCEKANTEGDRWSKTSAAVLGLHGDTPDTLKQYIKESSRIAGAGITSRILIEICLCTCDKNGGLKPSEIELSKLIARASLLARIGGFSDAIYFNALPPELSISPLGDILFRDDLGRMVVEPMLERIVGDKFISGSHYQKKNYEPAAIVPEVKGRLDDEFLTAWEIEMGFHIDEGRLIIEALEDKGVEDETVVYTIKKSEYISLVCTDKITENIAERFLKQFSISTRPNWRKPPEGFRLKDIYPWRFGRKLSYATRPILILDNNNDPILLIAPNSLRNAFVYLVGGSFEGMFDQGFYLSKEMRDSWWIKASEGHTFNAEVAKSLQEAGWKTRENIGLPEILNRKTGKEYGDLDVLAWQTDRPEILIIECKDLSLARNYSEIASMLSDYQGDDSKGKPDKLKKHLTRVEILEKNIDRLQKFTGTTTPRIVSCLVCSGIVPMQYARIDALSNTRVGNIKDILSL